MTKKGPYNTALEKAFQLQRFLLRPPQLAKSIAEVVDITSQQKRFYMTQTKYLFFFRLNSFNSPFITSDVIKWLVHLEVQAKTLDGGQDFERPDSVQFNNLQDQCEKLRGHPKLDADSKDLAKSVIISTKVAFQTSLTHHIFFLLFAYAMTAIISGSWVLISLDARGISGQLQLASAFGHTGVVSTKAAGASLAGFSPTATSSLFEHPIAEATDAAPTPDAVIASFAVALSSNM